MVTRSILLLLCLVPFPLHAAETGDFISTNRWILPAEETIEHVSFIAANQIAVDGNTFDDSFWLAQEDILLNGHFGNDVWSLSMIARLNGTFVDHARVLAQTIIVDGHISNGLWAAGGSISTTTNSVLHGNHFIYGDSVSLQGYIEGDVFAKSRSITLGGTIVGNVKLYGDDIVIRPGTTIIGDLFYATTNQSIVLDANSYVSGTLRHMTPPVFTKKLSPTWSALLELFWFGSALLVGLPLILAFPNPTGAAVRNLRSSLWKCGVVGIAVLFGFPIVVLAAMFTVIGVPFAIVTAAIAGLVIYLGKFPVALAVGTALLHKRGHITLSGALLSLVTGLFLYYCLALFPIIGSSLQTTATAFGTGSLILVLMAGRGNMRKQRDKTIIQSDKP